MSRASSETTLTVDSMQVGHTGFLLFTQFSADVHISWIVQNCRDEAWCLQSIDIQMSHTREIISDSASEVTVDRI